MATLKDIAEISGYSQSTISRVLKQDKDFKVSEKAKQTILKAANSLNYQNSKNHPEKTTMSEICIFSHDSGNNDIPNSYFKKIQDGITLQAYEENLTATFYDTKNLPSKIDTSRVIGAISIGAIRPKVIENLLYKDVSIIYIGQEPSSRQYSTVQTDYWTITEEILENFINKEITDIGLLSGDSTMLVADKSSLSITDTRYRSYKNYLMGKGLYNEERVKLGDYSMNDGYRITKEALENYALPEAIIVANDLMALGIMKACLEADLNIPKDVEIISYGNSEYAEITEVSISSVECFPEYSGKQSIQMLLDELGGRSQPHRISVFPEIVYRESALEI